ncbi:PhzF family phenazine biosynthesis protein [Mycolicibacterium setense]|uniref:PhzF family phenazine biosynthesis protein n=1 Tax=Mycolicibacterium setense TaxID=431269 RepID=UPI000574B6D1|nr:PhzF family phenazine biosynthesis protein [Mycolicibacterium setense]KHO24709.1 phenazine biosynthesis protein PhzF [Mycolicibacterium setense]MCV7110079.1 PhzF family phenazine biosynthesis protein [Mycolicibacterium setense]
MPRHRAFAQVDVFSRTPYLGNPVAVVLDSDGLDDVAMQRLARWTNLSETTFVLPPTRPEADYRLRIFTPGSELPFAGHPTLGSAHAWLGHGGQPGREGCIVQECGAGLVEIRQRDSEVYFQAPPTLRSGLLDDEYLNQIVDSFGVSRADVLAHQWVDNGPGWAVLVLASAQRVLELEPELARIPMAMVGVIGAYPPGSAHDYEMRTFAPGVGVPEDPVCGSMNASVGQWLTSTGAAPAHYRVSQGVRLGRAGEISVVAESDGTVWVGGVTTTCFEGVATL